MDAKSIVAGFALGMLSVGAATQMVAHADGPTTYFQESGDRWELSQQQAYTLRACLEQVAIVPPAFGGITCVTTPTPHCSWIDSWSALNDANRARAQGRPRVEVPAVFDGGVTLQEVQAALRGELDAGL